MRPCHHGSRLITFREVKRDMKHTEPVSKTLPATAYELPQHLYEIRSWTDIVLLIGLAIEIFFDWLLGTYILPREIWE